MPTLFGCCINQVHHCSLKCSHQYIVSTICCHQKRSRLTNLETATAATFFHSAILVFLSVHLLTGAFSCCNFYVYVVIFFSFVIVICILFMHVCCVLLNKVWVWVWVSPEATQKLKQICWSCVWNSTNRQPNSYAKLLKHIINTLPKRWIFCFTVEQSVPRNSLLTMAFSCTQT